MSITTLKAVWPHSLYDFTEEAVKSVVEELDRRGIDAPRPELVRCILWRLQDAAAPKFKAPLARIIPGSGLPLAGRAYTGEFGYGTGGGHRNVYKANSMS